MSSGVFPRVSKLARGRWALFAALLLAVLPAGLRAEAPAASGYRCEATWKPGGEGDCAYLTLDSQARRLYLARPDRVQIIDTESGALVRAIPGLEGGRGIAVAPDFRCGFAASGESDVVLTFNLTSLRPQGAPIKVGRKPAAIVYEPLTRRVVVFNAESHDASVIDPATSAVIATIPLGGAPGSAAADGRGALFVNLEDKNEVLTVDAQTNTVVHHWPLAPGAGQASLALDPVKRRLFAGCCNGQMIVLDAQTGKHLAELPMGQGADACAFDPGAGVVFAASSDGTLTVVQEDVAKPGAYQVAETLKTPGGARAMAVDPRTHAVYLATATVAGAGSETSEKAPESFALLKYTR